MPFLPPNQQRQSTEGSKRQLCEKLTVAIIAIQKSQIYLSRAKPNHKKMNWEGWKVHSSKVCKVK